VLVPVLVLVLLPAAASAQPCAWSGSARVARVTIPTSGPSVAVRVDGHEVTVTPLGAGRVRVESASSLAWAGTAAERDVSIGLQAEARLAEGALVLRAPTPVALVAMPRDGAPRVDAELAEGLWVRAVEVPCAALTLAEVTDALPELPPASAEVVARRPTLEVHARPGGPSVRLEGQRASAIRLDRLERDREWVHVRRVLDHGSILDGWVRAAHVREVPPAPRTEQGLGFGRGSGCGHGASHTYVGPATLIAGSELRVSQDGPVWAVASEDVPVRITMRWGAAWGYVHEIPGLRALDVECETHLRHAWAPRTAFRLPQPVP
jgi:hypothetical protein